MKKRLTLMLTTAVFFLFAVTSQSSAQRLSTDLAKKAPKPTPEQVAQQKKDFAKRYPLLAKYGQRKAHQAESPFAVASPKIKKQMKASPMLKAEGAPANLLGCMIYASNWSQDYTTTSLYFGKGYMPLSPSCAVHEF